MSALSTFTTYGNSDDPLFGGASVAQLQDYYDSIEGKTEDEIEQIKRNCCIYN